MNSNNHRILSNNIAGYKPRYWNPNLLKIDLELNALSAALRISDGNFSKAKRLYEEGIHNVSVAHLTLSSPISFNIPVGTSLKGVNDFNQTVLGVVYGRNAYIGDKEIMFMYNDINSAVTCLVGSYPIENQEISGCLSRCSYIQVSIKNPKTLFYSYNPFTDNDNGLTLKSLSNGAKHLMNDCNHCPYDDYLKFRKYYGSTLYAEEWIEAAFEGRKTNFFNGNANFQPLSFDARGEVIHKIIAFMSIWMNVIAKMEHAIDLCGNPQAIRSWDDAVALYTGSLGEDGESGGLLPYSLAKKRCKQFNTCQNGGSGEKESVNGKIFQLFQNGQNNIAQSACNSVKEFKEEIVRFMTVPLIQSTLYYAHINNYQTFKNEEEQIKARSEGVAFAASVLPIIHFCSDLERSRADSDIIFQNLAPGSVQTDFKTVKTAFERNYGCLGLSCVDIGGIYDPYASNGEYLIHASPCEDVLEKDIKEMKTTFVTILGFTSFIIVITCCFLPCRRRRLLKRGEDIPPVEEDIINLNEEASDDDMEVLSIIDNRGIL